MRSHMEYSFAQVPAADIPRSNFRRPFTHKTTFQAGYLIPVYADEVLPGDTFNVKASMFARMATPLYPIMDNLRMDVFFFFVPNRLLWSNWQKFMGEQANPGDSISFLVPQVTTPGGGFANGSLFDYLGVPTQVAGVGTYDPVAGTATWAGPCAFWSRAYNRIWNEWFRDENLQNSVTVDQGDGPDTAANYVLKRRGKRHDYFTSCLPWAQKGTGVSLPLGTSALVRTTPSDGVTGAQNPVRWRIANGGVPTDQARAAFFSGNTQLGTSTGDITGFAQVAGSGVYPTNLYADLSTATAATINSLRLAFQTQKLLERDARGGTRYIEILKSHFGVTSPDARLQRAEFLGGGQIPINVSAIAQTSATAITGSATPLGRLGAIGTAGGSGIGFTKSFVEHGVILGLVAVTADLTYQYGLNRMFSRRSRYDFYWPAFANLGEQGVYNQEIYAQGAAADIAAFGYQERWAEYRYKPSLVTGQFRSNYATPLDAWHLAEKFTSLPALNDTFIQANLDTIMARVQAVAADPVFIFDSFFDVQTARPMPMYSVPGLIDHF